MTRRKKHQYKRLIRKHAHKGMAYFSDKPVTSIQEQLQNIREVNKLYSIKRNSNENI
jgi:hypothetical protein